MIKAITSCIIYNHSFIHITHCIHTQFTYYHISTLLLYYSLGSHQVVLRVALGRIAQLGGDDYLGHAALYSVCIVYNVYIECIGLESV